MLLFFLLNYSCTKEFDLSEKEKIIVLQSKAYSNVHLEDNTADRTIRPFLGMIITDAPDNYNYDAYTYGETSTFEQLGERIDWTGSFKTEQDTTTQIFGTGTDYFFLYVRNLTSTSYGPITINYGTSDAITESIGIPDDGIIYRIAYYKAYPNTSIRFYESPGQSNYIELTANSDFEFPNTENQCALVTIENKKGYLSFQNIAPDFSINADKLK